jgi:SAM-dependent methyltransferase
MVTQIIDSKNKEINWESYGQTRNLDRHRLLRKFHRQALKIFIHFFKDLDISLSVLDAGCGSGFYLEILRNLGFQSLRGIDVCEYFIQKTRDKGLNVKNQSIHDLDTKDAYDIILCCDVLEHLNNPKQAISKLHQALKPKGTLYVSIPVYDSILERKERLLKKKSKKDQMKKHDSTHVNEFSRKTFLHLLEENGFRVFYIKHFFNQIPIVWRLSGRIPDFPTFNRFGKFLVLAARKI